MPTTKPSKKDQDAALRIRMKMAEVLRGYGIHSPQLPCADEIIALMKGSTYTPPAPDPEKDALIDGLIGN